MLFEARNTIEDRFCEDLENSSILPESYSRIARIDIRQGKPLFLLSIATRIDTLAIGITFSVLGHSIFEVVLVIGIITFFVCMKGRSYGSILSGKP